jgi:hypothetical protein
MKKSTAKKSFKPETSNLSKNKVPAKAGMMKQCDCGGHKKKRG